VPGEGLTPRQLEEELDEHGDLDAIEAAHPELADHLRGVRQRSDAVGRQVRALARAFETWGGFWRSVDEWLREELERVRERVRREHLRLVRSDKYEEAMKRKLPPRQSEAVMRTRELMNAARDTGLSPEVLFRAALLEVETERSASDRRRGPKPAQVRMEESLKVAQHGPHDAEAILGVPKDRAAWIRQRLGLTKRRR
jgi:hypothetical protein